MPLSGALLVTVVVRFALKVAVELEHGVNAYFPDPLRDPSPLRADSDFARVPERAALPAARPRPEVLCGLPRGLGGRRRKMCGPTCGMELHRHLCPHRHTWGRCTRGSLH